MDIGIDEVGRGSLAGPLVVGAVSLVKPISGLKDSKQLTSLQRQRLAASIYKEAKSATLGWVWPHEIDELGLTLATTLAMERALTLITHPIKNIIIDGKVNYLSSRDHVKTIIKADSLIPDVSAASIIAKIARDDYMHYIDKVFPNYGFVRHVGYGTNEHLKAIKTYGPCSLHRLTFKPVRYY